MLEMKIMTEALIVSGNKVLLGQRKKNGFGHGKWLGFGGKLENSETIDQAMTREFFEETSIKVLEFAKRGILTFHYINDPDMEVHYYEVLKYKGEPQESNEMAVRWFNIESIPYDQMFPNDQYWLPMFLKKKFFKGEFYFNNKYEIDKYDFKTK